MCETSCVLKFVVCSCCLFSPCWCWRLLLVFVVVCSGCLVIDDCASSSLCVVRCCVLFGLVASWCGAFCLFGGCRLLLCVVCCLLFVDCCLLQFVVFFALLLVVVNRC